MRPASRSSIPEYMYAENGHTCGNCGQCDIDNIFNPACLGLCASHDRAVNIRRATTCNDWTPREEVAQ